MTSFFSFLHALVRAGVTNPYKPRFFGYPRPRVSKHEKCETTDCRSRGVWEVGYQSRRRRVCGDCRDYLIEACGWEFRRSLYNKHREVAK